MLHKHGHPAHLGAGVLQQVLKDLRLGQRVSEASEASSSGEEGDEGGVTEAPIHYYVCAHTHIWTKPTPRYIYI